MDLLSVCRWGLRNVPCMNAHSMNARGNPHRGNICGKPHASSVHVLTHVAFCPPPELLAATLARLLEPTLRQMPPAPRRQAKQPLVFDVSKRNALSKLDKSPKGSLDAPIAALVHAINRHKDYVTTSSCSGRIALYESDSRWRPGGRWLLVEHRQVTLSEVEAALATAPVGHIDSSGAPRPNTSGGTAAASPPADGDDDAGCVSLKVEPAILHIQCRDVDAAKRLLQVGLRAGFRESGLVLSDGSTKTMLAIRTTSNCLELPLALAAITPHPPQPAGGHAPDADDDASSPSPISASAAPAASGRKILVGGDYLRYVVSHANDKFAAMAARSAKLEAEFLAMVAADEAAAAAANAIDACSHATPPMGRRRRSRQGETVDGATPALAGSAPTPGGETDATNGIPNKAAESRRTSAEETAARPGAE